MMGEAMDEEMEEKLYSDLRKKESEVIDIDKVYFIFNDFDRVYHYDWSYYENLRRITNRTGKIITLDNDSINFKDIDLRDGIKMTLSSATSKDTLDICSAINISSPGGLGKRDLYDTNSLPNVSVREIMDYSAKYDRISYQYSNNYIDIFDFIIPRLIFLNKKHGSLDISLSLMFLEILAKIPDSHISRKFGEKIAKKTSNNASDLLKILDKESSHEYLTNQLSKLDYEYKKKGINPGTTADLLLASLMIYKIFISN